MEEVLKFETTSNSENFLRYIYEYSKLITRSICSGWIKA